MMINRIDEYRKQYGFYTVDEIISEVALENPGIPFFHRHPSDCLLDPLVQTQLTEGILLAGILLCRVAGSFNFINADCDIKARIGFSPYPWVCPII